jgi:hypothetical protein
MQECVGSHGRSAGAVSCWRGRVAADVALSVGHERVFRLIARVAGHATPATDELNACSGSSDDGAAGGAPAHEVKSAAGSESAVPIPTAWPDTA